MKHKRTRRSFRPPTMMFRHSVALTLGLLLVLAVIAPLHAQRAPPEVTVATPMLKTVVQWDEYTGQFEAVRRVEVRARVSGELVGIHFADGDVVKAGQLLFTIDRRPFDIAVEVACGDVARAKAQVVLAAADFERAEKLATSSVVTQRDRDQRKAVYDVVRAQGELSCPSSPPSKS